MNVRDAREKTVRSGIILTLVSSPRSDQRFAPCCNRTIADHSRHLLRPGTHVLKAMGEAPQQSVSPKSSASWPNATIVYYKPTIRINIASNLVGEIVKAQDPEDGNLTPIIPGTPSIKEQKLGPSNERPSPRQNFVRLTLVSSRRDEKLDVEIPRPEESVTAESKIPQIFIQSHSFFLYRNPTNLLREIRMRYSPNSEIEKERFATSREREKCAVGQNS